MKGFSELVPEEVVWEDISQMDESWASEGQVSHWYGDAAEALVTMLGYVIFEDSNNILLAGSYIESLELYGNVHKIPKAVIRSRHRLPTGGD